MQALLAAGADPAVTATGGHNALRMAALNGHEGAVRLLRTQMIGELATQKQGGAAPPSNGCSCNDLVVGPFAMCTIQ